MVSIDLDMLVNVPSPITKPWWRFWDYKMYCPKCGKGFTYSQAYTVHYVGEHSSLNEVL